MLIKAPFIALSATVGEPEIFLKWLEMINNVNAERVKGGQKEHKVNYIRHRERWSDLDKFMFLPANPFKGWNGRKSYLAQGMRERPEDFKSECIRMHPAGAIAMGLGLNREMGFPPDLAFSPTDSWNIYEQMVEALAYIDDEEIKSRMAQLHPDLFFEPLSIGKKEARAWEKCLKKELMLWVTQGGKTAVEWVDKILNKMNRKPNKRIHELEVACAKLEINPWRFQYVVDNLLALLYDLKWTSKLPAIIFCLNRNNCMKLLERIVSDLEEMEQQMKMKEAKTHTKEDLIRRRRELKKAEKRAKQLAKTAEKDSKKSSKKMTGDERDEARQDRIGKDVANEEPIIEEEVEEKVDPRFTFLQSGELMDPGDLQFWEYRATQHLGPNNILLKCLSRGIGVHHAGLGTHYTQLVETLFRYRHLKVIISTETLAMGINMPAKTVVFAGDDSGLNPLNYRQMHGRAGRRGYDNIGNVIFMGIRPRKVANLMTAQLTSLHGHFPITPTLVLRSCNVVHKYKKKDFALSCVSNLLKPEFGPDKDKKEFLESTSRQIKNLFRYYLDFFIQRRMLTIDARPLGMNGLVAHLHKYEPGNFIFAELLESGIFKELCEGFQTKKAVSGRRETALCILNILVRIFLHIPIIYGTRPNEMLEPERGTHVAVKKLVGPKDAPDTTVQQPEVDRRKGKRGKKQENVPTKIPTELTLGQKVLRELKKTHDDSLDHFKSSVRGFVDAKLTVGDDCVLPVSKLRVGGDEEKTRDDGFVKILKQTSIPTVVRTPFMAAAGLDDNFGSSREILESLRDDMAVTELSLAIGDQIDMRGRPMELNAVVIDFFTHGKYKRLFNENGLRDGHTWNLLKQWQVLLKKIREGLRELSPLDKRLKKRREEAAEEQRLEDLNYTELRPIQRGTVHRRGTKIYKDLNSGLLVYEDQRKKITVVEKDEDADDITAAFSYLFREYKLVFEHINYGSVHEKAKDTNPEVKEDDEDKTPEKDIAARLAEAERLAAGKPKKKKGKKKGKSKEGKSKDTEGKKSKSKTSTKPKSSSSKTKSTTSKDK